jgi:decaprenylphospho-beta-D-erythro-pentofuranosid-2-ulose 2-reductase
MNQGGISNAVIIGATSAIAQAVARGLAPRGVRFVLVGRDASKLSAVADDLRVRGAAQVDFAAVSDLADLGEHGRIVDTARFLLGSIDLVLIAHGSLPDQKRVERDAPAVIASIELNAIGVISLMTRFANALEEQRRGMIAVIGSVAGDRGRRSNYVYGTAKAAIEAFASGLRARLAGAGVGVLLVKPGFVDTPMTASLRKNVLFASPDAVGTAIVRAIDRRYDVVYVPGFWRWILLAVRLLPESVFKRLKF